MTKKTKKIQQVKKRPVGRPDNYKPEYCEMIIEHMSTGKSLVSFCAKIGTHKETARQWMLKYPEFHASYKKAKGLAQDWWEDLLLKTASGEHKGNLGAQVFWMKNRFRDDWQDRIENVHEVRQMQPLVVETDDGNKTELNFIEGDEKVE